LPYSTGRIGFGRIDPMESIALNKITHKD